MITWCDNYCIHILEEYIKNIEVEKRYGEDAMPVVPFLKEIIVQVKENFAADDLVKEGHETRTFEGLRAALLKLKLANNMNRQVEEVFLDIGWDLMK